MPDLPLRDPSGCMPPLTLLFHCPTIRRRYHTGDATKIDRYKKQPSAGPPIPQIVPAFKDAQRPRSDCRHGQR